MSLITPSRQRGASLILISEIAGLFLVIFTAVYFGFFRQYAVGPAVSLTPSTSIAPTPTAPANWKTYTNTEYGFEVKYPGQVAFEKPSVSKDGSSVRIEIQNYDTAVESMRGIQPGEYHILILAGPKSDTLHCDTTIKNPIDLGSGIIGYEDKDWSNEGESGPLRELCVEGNTDIFIQVAVGSIHDFSLGDQILSSFRLIDTARTWETFNSEYFTISFSVPSNVAVYDSKNYIGITDGNARFAGEHSAFFSIRRFLPFFTKDRLLDDVQRNLQNVRRSMITVDGSTFLEVEGDVPDVATIAEYGSGNFVADEYVAKGHHAYVFFDKSVLHIGPMPGQSDTLTLSEMDQTLSTIRFSSSKISATPPEWKTYYNAENGFQLSYPSDLVIISDGGNDVAWVVAWSRVGNFGDAPIGGTVNVSNSTKTLDELKHSNPYIAWRSGPQYIGGQPAIIGISGEFAQSYGAVIHNSMLYELSNELVANDQILSTFKFTK